MMSDESSRGCRARVEAGAAVGAAGMVAVGGKEPQGSLTLISADRNSLMKAWS